MKRTATQPFHVLIFKVNSSIKKRLWNQLFQALGLLLLLVILAPSPASAQQTKALNTLGQKIQSDKKVRSYVLNKERGSVQSITFKNSDAYPATATKAVIENYFNLREGIDSYLPKNTVSANGHLTIDRYQQSFKGIEVAYGTIAVGVNDNKISYLNGDHYIIDANTSIVPVRTEAEALTNALAIVNAQKYMWQEPRADQYAKTGGYPRGELVFINDFIANKGVFLAYRFDIYATEPMSREYVYINATDGSLLLRDAILKHANATGTAATRYNGVQTIVTDSTGTGYRLRHTLPTMLGIETLNTQRTWLYGNAIDFVDADNNWTAAEYSNANKDDALLDAQWGAEQVYNFWKSVMGRNSYDNAGGKILSYVHFGTQYNNAFWNGISMVYGDGSYPGNANGFKPLTSLDVCSHEIAHAVCTYTSNLLYQKESGAMNEGFSDIWAACVEHYVDPANAIYETFLVGEQITNGWIKNTNRIALRDMQNPSAQGQPDTYGGTNWISVVNCTPTSSNDYCGVHRNSGVLNKWFYVLTMGEAGTNDLSNAYSVTGIGFEKAQQIAYALELSLTPTSTHAIARDMAISAAATLYGDCSPEVIATTNAWYAVGVGAVYSSTCSPLVYFVNAAATVSESNAATGCRPSKTITTTLRIDADPVQAAVITLIPSGTAIQGVDYDLSPTSFTLTSGAGSSQNITITVYDDAIIEGSETLNLGYTLNANGGSAVAGTTNQTYSLTITDDDIAPVFGTTVTSADTLLNQDFGTSGGNLPAGWVSANEAGINTWVVGNNGGVGTGQGAYITNNTTTKPLTYSSTSTSLAYLRTPLVNAANVSGMNFAFRYTCMGEQDVNDVYDYGYIQYSLDGTNFSRLPDLLLSVSSAKTFTLSLPDSLFANKTFTLEFRWANDNSVSGGAPFSIDDVLLTGTKTIHKTAVETQSSGTKSEYIPATSSVNIYSSDDRQLLGMISGASADVGCVTVSLASTGTGQSTLSTTTDSYNRTQKVFQITPSVANAATNYQLTLYFTPAELAVWGANKLNLSFLKVTDGVSLAGTVPAADFVAVTPTNINDQTADGYIAYTGNFTGFSQFMLGEMVSNPLPVDFLYLKATPGNNLIHLTWATANERSNDGFGIERSEDGKKFSGLGWIKGRNSKGEQQYVYDDKQVVPGVRYYYRIRQVDVNGKITYSEIQTVMLTADEHSRFTLFPNPASNALNLTFNQTSGTAIIRISTIQGTLMKEVYAASVKSPVTIDIAGFPAGFYIISATTDSGIWVDKFLKQ